MTKLIYFLPSLIHRLTYQNFSILKNIVLIKRVCVGKLDLQFLKQLQQDTTKNTLRT